METLSFGREMCATTSYSVCDSVSCLPVAKSFQIKCRYRYCESLVNSIIGGKASTSGGVIVDVYSDSVV